MDWPHCYLFSHQLVRKPAIAVRRFVRSFFPTPQRCLGKSRRSRRACAKFFTSTGGAFTTDMWTCDMTKRSYMTITVHYVQKGILHDRILATVFVPVDVSHTEETINKIHLNTFDVFGLRERFESAPHRFVFVTDRGSNMISAFKEYNHISCFTHLLSNLVCKMCKELETRLLLNARKLVFFVKQRGLNGKLTTTFKEPCETRWKFQCTSC